MCVRITLTLWPPGTRVRLSAAGLVPPTPNHPRRGPGPRALCNYILQIMGLTGRRDSSAAPCNSEDQSAGTASGLPVQPAINPCDILRDLNIRISAWLTICQYTPMIKTLKLEHEWRELAAIAATPALKARYLAKAEVLDRISTRLREAAKPSHIRLKYFLPPP